MIGIIICFIFILILQLLTPFWWWIMVVPFIYSFVRARSGWKGFQIGMLSAGLLWFLSSLYMYLTGSKIISTRIAQMFNIGIPWIMVILTTLIAALAAGFAGLAGYSLRAFFRESKKD